MKNSSSFYYTVAYEMTNFQTEKKSYIIQLPCYTAWKFHETKFQKKKINKAN